MERRVVIEGEVSLSSQIDGDAALRTSVDGETSSYMAGTYALMPLTVTANGEYTPPPGFGYSPVTIDIAVPSNYGLIEYDGHTIRIS